MFSPGTIYQIPRHLYLPTVIKIIDLTKPAIMSLRRSLQRSSLQAAIHPRVFASRFASSSASSTGPSSPSPPQPKGKGKAKGALPVSHLMMYQLRSISVLSSCPAGTALTGLATLKTESDPIAKPDADYPPWLWTILMDGKLSDLANEPRPVVREGQAFDFTKEKKRLRAV